MAKQPVHFANPRVHGHRPLLPAQEGFPLNRLSNARGHQPFRPLPAPVGTPPYHLQLSEVLPPDQIASIDNAQRLVLHVVGDTGGVKTPVPQMNVARRMVLDCAAGDAAHHPAFFYHLGDVVYFYGKSSEYFPQFYEPYEAYPGVIMAIPGNHDGDLSPAMQAQGTPSLDAFMNNFCQRIAHHTPDAHDALRLAMTQPNVYWTLHAPLVTIIGLYTNVPEGGQLDDTQIAWLHEELHAAPSDRFLIVAMHHPIYSLDQFHSGSAYLHGILNDAVAQTGRIPDAVFAGHVHNYQRFTRAWSGRQVPFIVAGGGGYHNLHTIPAGVAPGSNPSPNDPDVTLETFNDHQFGFLRLDITPDTLKGSYFGVSGFQDPSSVTADPPFNSFTLSRAAGTVTTAS